MPKQKQTAPIHFRGMAEFFELMAANQYKEWAEMRYKKATKTESGHTSKKKFEAQRRFVWQSYKLSAHRIKLLRAVQKELETGEKQDLEEEPEGSVDRVSKLITTGFKSLMP